MIAQQEKFPLREVLRSVEEQYSVSFTFLDKNIEAVFIDPPPEKLSLSEVVNFLHQKTRLTFTQLDQQFIAISEPDVMPTKICGVIIDEETNERIAGATIQYDTSYTVSSKDGYFEISDLKENSAIIVRSFGYKRVFMEARTLMVSPCKTVVLQLQSSTLHEIIITDYLTTGIKKRLDGSLSIQTKDLGMLPGLTDPDILFTVQALPGILSIDETVSNINVRGGTNDQNLVLWDGIKMYQQGHFFGLISAFNPYLINEVSLIKNGTSTSLSDGVSSTIDMRSDDKVAKSFSGGAGINMINGDFFSKIPLSSKSSLQVSARRSIADVLETPTYRAYYDRAFRGTDVVKPISNGTDTISAKTNFNFYDFNVKFLYDITDKDKLRVNVLKIQNNIDYRENAFVNSVLESKTSGLKQQNTAAGISYNRLWNSSVRTSGLWYLSRYNLDAVNFDIPNDQRLIQKNEVLETGLKLDARVSFSDHFDLFTGYQFIEVGVSNVEDVNNPLFYRFKKEVLRTHVLFAETNYTSPSNATNIRAGVRTNLFSTFKKVIVEPRISINQKLSEVVSLELLGEMKSQSTTQIIDFQNDFLGIEKRKWVLANEKDIPIIRSKQISAGVHFNKKNFLMVLETYFKGVDDIITSSQGFQNQFQFVRSAGSYESAGLEFLANRRINKINSWISYSYAKSNFCFKELVPPNFPSNLDIRHRATGGVSYQSNHVDVSCGINWHTGRPVTAPSVSNSIVAGEINYQTPNGSRLQSYWRIDLSVKYKFHISKLIRAMAGISIWNMTDHQNVVDAYYQIDSPDQINFYQRNALGFTPNIMFRVDF